MFNPVRALGNSEINLNGVTESSICLSHVLLYQSHTRDRLFVESYLVKARGGHVA